MKRPVRFRFRCPKHLRRLLHMHLFDQLHNHLEYNWLYLDRVVLDKKHIVLFLRNDQDN
jgi:hypothetical protein